MARNRMVKPEFFTSLHLSKISIDANYLFIGLWVFGDDYGVYPYSNRAILGDIYRYRYDVTDNDIEQLIKELIDIGVIIMYNYNDKNYLIILNWNEHQKVDKPSSRRYIPDEILTKIINKHSIDTVSSESTDSIDTVSSESVSKEKEKEKEKEKDIIETWRNNFEIYKSEFEIEYNKLINDNIWINNNKHLYPSIDIKLSIEKSYKNYWITEAGWKNKKSKRSLINPDYRQTLIKAIDFNPVKSQKTTNNNNKTYYDPQYKILS
jgi:hypothetical protein